MYEDILCHHGVKGQKWGVRRYQNSDGTLTPAGEQRYRKSELKREIKQLNLDRYNKEAAGTGLLAILTKNTPRTEEDNRSSYIYEHMLTDERLQYEKTKALVDSYVKDYGDTDIKKIVQQVENRYTKYSPTGIQKAKETVMGLLLGDVGKFIASTNSPAMKYYRSTYNKHKSEYNRTHRG